MARIFSDLASRTAAFAGKPIGFAVAVASIILWAATGPVFHFSDTWQLVVNTATTVVTFLMVFPIQNSQNRDAAAIQAKLDEIIRAVSEARNEFIGIEHLTDAQLTAIRNALEAEAVAKGSDASQAHETVDRLLGRR